MSSYEEFFLNSKARTVLLETVEISHPSFTQVYRIVRNARQGITAKIETDVFVDFQYYPMRIETTGSNGTLDQSFKFTVGDLGEIIQTELDAIEADDTHHIKPLCIYRAYRSDQLDQAVYGPIVLEISSIPVNRDGFAFEAKPYQANANATGEIYSLNRFSGLRGFL
jgi:hypothetical protein